MSIWIIAATTADIDKCGMLLEEVRHGTIYGRSSDMRMDDDRFTYPDDEFTVAEFIEAVARAGYYFFKDAAQKKAAAAMAAGTPMDPDEEVHTLFKFLPACIDVFLNLFILDLFLNL